MPANLSKPDTIIHLISDQTMQNILPILAFQPRRVVQVASQPAPQAPSRWADRARWIEETVNLARERLGLPFEVEWMPPRELNVESPSVEDTASFVSGLLSEHPGALVNYTGGTKNMAIGAWLAASRAGSPLVYCDTPHQFLLAGSPAVSPPRAMEELAHDLTVPLILASQGRFEGRQWNRGEDPASSLEAMGRCSHDLMIKHGAGFRDYRFQIRCHGMPVDISRARAVDVARVQEEPVPEPPNREFAVFLDAAVIAGLLIRKGNAWYYSIPPGAKSKERLRAVERTAKGVVGFAFEALVGAQLRESNRFSDFLPNVFPAGNRPEDQGFGESDFLAYEPNELALTLISCKSDPPRLEHLEALLARKAQFGGLHARTLLCVEAALEPRGEARLRSWCRTLGIDCAIADEVGPMIRDVRMPGGPAG